MGSSASLAKAEETPSANVGSTHSFQDERGYALLVQLCTASDLPTLDTASSGRVAAFVHKTLEKIPISSYVWWTHGRNARGRHVWRQWRKLDFSPDWLDTASLRIELCDTGDSEAHFETRLGGTSIRINRLLQSSQLIEAGWGPIFECECDVSSKNIGTPCHLTLRARIIHQPTAFSAPRIVFVMRHAESLWNHAVSHANVITMLSQIDHGLSIKGVRQAIELAHKLKQRLKAPEPTKLPLHAKTVSDLEDLFLASPALYSSPFKRAVQTSLLALQWHPAAKNSIRLLPLAREVRRAYSRDNIGCARGDSISHKALSDLRLNKQVIREMSDEVVLSHQSSFCTTELGSVCDTQGSQPSFCDVSESTSFTTQQPDTCLDSLPCDSPMCVDSADAENEWWSASAEDADEVMNRATEFFDFVRFMESDTCIIVTHSEFLRQVFRRQKFGCVDNGREFASRKIGNCSVLAMKVDLSQAAGSEVVEAQFLFGSGFESSAPGILPQPHVIPMIPPPRMSGKVMGLKITRV